MLKNATLPGLETIASSQLLRARGPARSDSRKPEQESPPGVDRKPLWELFQAGHMLELSGRGAGKLSAVVRLITRAQAQGEPVAWVAARDDATFYPPDLAQAGVELATLVVVRLGAERPAPAPSGAHAMVRAAEMLLRSGAFGLVVIDMTAGVPRGELTWQARLAGLARRHAARVVFLTSSAGEAPSLGPLVSLRAEPSWREGPGQRAQLSYHLIKSKLDARADVSPDVRCLPAGATSHA